MEYLSKTIVKYVDQVYMLNNDQKEIMEFGIQSTLEIGLNVFISIFILYKMEMLIEGLVFFSVFIPIRTLSGGYHSDTYLRCLFFSIATLIIVMNVSKYITINSNVVLVMIILFAICIGKIGPIINAERPISKNEYKRFSNGLKKALFIVTIASFFIVILQLERIANIILLCLGLILCTLIVGKIKYKQYQLEN